MKQDFLIVLMLVTMVGILGYAVPTFAAQYFTTNNGFYNENL